MEKNNEKTLNPWVSMWTRPRETIQQIVSSNPERLVLILAALTGFSSALSQASTKDVGDTFELPMIFGSAAIGGPISGIIGLYIGGALIRWTGAWIGGTATSKNIRAALAWSSVPVIWALLLWIPEIALFGDELFSSATPRMDANESLLFSFMGFTVVQLTVSVWTIVVFLKCIGQVQGFSAWKALGNILLVVLAIFIPIVVVGLVFTALA